MMSAPPVNSPSTYSCGIVGQLEYSYVSEHGRDFCNVKSVKMANIHLEVVQH